MSNFPDDATPNTLHRVEHNANAGAKRVVLRYQDPVTGSWNNFAPSTLLVSAWDYVAYTNTNTTTDTYVFKTGGSSGITVATVTIVYTDTTKSQISTVTRT